MNPKKSEPKKRAIPIRFTKVNVITHILIFYISEYSAEYSAEGSAESGAK